MDKIDSQTLPVEALNERRQAVAELIRQPFVFALPVSSSGLHRKRWGDTPQKPLQRAYEQSPAAVKKWLQEQYPAIAASAKACARVNLPVGTNLRIS